MKDDYLWDRTGEPDPEIQELEQILGTLRYQPRPMELPAQVRVGRPLTFFPRVAIAAAVATLLVGGASWWLLQRPNAPVGLESVSNPPLVESPKMPPQNVAPPITNEIVASSTNHKVIQNKPQRNGFHKNLIASNKQSRARKSTDPELSTRDRAEAEAARDQLLLALRVASSKLSLVQKKAQSGYPGAVIRNQHKVG